MFGREAITFYVVQIQFIRDRPIGLTQIVLVRYVLQSDFNPVKPSAQSFYCCRIKQICGVIEKEIIDGAGDAHGVVVQLCLDETPLTEEVFEVEDQGFVLVVKPNEVRGGNRVFTTAVFIGLIICFFSN